MIIKDNGFFVSVFSPQGGSGVSTISVAAGVELASKKYNTVIIFPGGNYDYCPEPDTDRVYNLSEAYFSYTKGKPVCSVAKDEEVKKKPIDIILSKFQSVHKSDLVYYAPFNSFLEIEEISDKEYMDFILESFKHSDIAIIDTGRIPPFKLCGILDISSLIVIVVNCTDEFYIDKVEGFVKSIIKVMPSEYKSFFEKCIYALNPGAEKDINQIKNCLGKMVGLKDARIYQMPCVSNIFHLRNASFRLFGDRSKKTGLLNLTNEIIRARGDISDKK